MAEQQELPKNYFNLPDGRYCFVLEDRIAVVSKLATTEWPEPTEGPDMGSLILFGIISAVTLVLSVLFFIVGFYPLAAMTTLACIVSGGAFLRSLKYSASPAVYRNTIIACTYHKVNFGYDYFLVTYTTKSGKSLIRRFPIYDSAEIAAKAIALFQAEGLLPAAS